MGESTFETARALTCGVVRRVADLSEWLHHSLKEQLELYAIPPTPAPTLDKVLGHMLLGCQNVSDIILAFKLSTI